MSFTSTSHFGDVTGGRIVPRLHKVAEQLGCRPSLVDVIAIDHGYAMLAVFDHDGQLNELAMKEFVRLTRATIDPEDEADQLHGPVLTLTLED
ncbi:hypothetical protein A8B98_22860 [Hymenobacter sp. UV11]|nr:hypothetical protein A8B98_22860 [Hymenobacter sp. UV11]